MSTGDYRDGWNHGCCSKHRLDVSRVDGAFEHLPCRGPINVPLLSVAARVNRSTQDSSRAETADVVVSALDARPQRIRAATIVRPGTSLDALIRDVVRRAFADCKPLPDLDEDAE